MIIEKILNNNVAIVLNAEGIETIVMGRGICFNKRVGDIIDPGSIDKEFILNNAVMNQRFKEIVAELPMEYLSLGESIINDAKSKLDKRISDTIYISLIDHIHNAVERAKEGIHIRNVLLWDIKRFYKKEFAVALHALKIIEEETGVVLNEDEAGFIALHFVNAQLDDNVMDMYQTTTLMQEITNIVKYTFNTEFDEESTNFYRFVTHLKFFVIRILKGEEDRNKGDDGLFEVVKVQYKNSYACVLKIADFINNNYNYNLSNDEKLYLTIHIERVIYKNNKQ